jgi:hypothetical protein
MFNNTCVKEFSNYRICNLINVKSFNIYIHFNIIFYSLYRSNLNRSQKYGNPIHQHMYAYMYTYTYIHESNEFEPTTLMNEQV